MSSLNFVLQLLGSVYHRAYEHLIAAQQGYFYVGGGGGGGVSSHSWFMTSLLGFQDLQRLFASA